MKIRILFLMALSVLSGCAASNIYMGPALPTCGGPVTDPKFQSKGCMTGAEYDIARKKARYAVKEAAEDSDQDEAGKANRRYKE